MARAYKTCEGTYSNCTLHFCEAGGSDAGDFTLGPSSNENIYSKKLG